MVDALRALLADRKPRTTLLLGASDTGKTTLLESLLRTWDPGEPVAVVDCDVGQSHVGPPTTVAWGLIERPFTGWRQVAVRGMVFTGDASPEGNLDTFLSAVSGMVEAARRHAAHLFIDTTGLAEGGVGVELKQRKMALIRPDLIVALQREQELAPLLTRAPAGTRVERLPASADCVRRPLTARAAYRDRQFVRYFVNSATHDVRFDHLRWLGVGRDRPAQPVSCSPAALMDRVIGLRTAQDAEVALGLVRDVDPEQRRVALLTPAREVSAVTTIAVGSLRWPAQSDG